MKIKSVRLAIAAVSFFLVYQPLSFAQEPKVIVLPSARREGGKPLMQVLKERKSDRAFSAKELPLEVLSDLLWAANGITRPGHRTAPTAMNRQEIDIYIAKADGLYLYHAEKNSLILISEQDLREATGSQPFVKEAALNLIFVADFSRMAQTDAASREFYSAIDTGFISQNVYLFCASIGLNTVVRGWVDREALAKMMKLGPEQKIILAQSVGYPKE